MNCVTLFLTHVVGRQEFLFFSQRNTQSVGQPSASSRSTCIYVASDGRSTNFTDSNSVNGRTKIVDRLTETKVVDLNITRNLADCLSPNDQYLLIFEEDKLLANAYFGEYIYA